ncbi:VPLPA-CTERM sorting domain-containing protein [Litoreibacter arenae]|uniref:PEP-CTERM protein-sorting domain-containing protein n=1 Tax=Litoreibacter arenae DSM 19593 TaxID=1123360 RepID=S9RM24_9RHOB|nr:VPLPA-CTERM sorting domain-containing protein [Litoreibacter arenae]EPX79135.1 hypothetical protein thalar_01954 [Litoreibacter arenae DSM 19593]
MSRLFNFGLIAVASISVGFSAAARTVDFDFTTSPDSPGTYERSTSLSFQQGGLDLDVSAHGYSTPGSVGDPLATHSDIDVSRRDGYGLYVAQGWQGWFNYDDPRVDGWYNEVVQFDFNQTDVSIERIVFGDFNGGSDFDLFVGDGGVLYYEGTNQVFQNAVLDTETSSLFAIGASDNFSSFMIRSVEVSVLDGTDGQPSPVPLPAGGALMLTAIGILTATRKWSRKT